MKSYISLIIFLFFMNNCFGQADSINFSIPSKDTFDIFSVRNVNIFEDYEQGVEMRIDAETKDTSIIIYGDTIKAIKSLFKIWNDLEIKLRLSRQDAEDWKFFADKWKELYQETQRRTHTF